MGRHEVTCEVSRREPGGRAEACAQVRGGDVFVVARDQEGGRPVVHMAYAGQPGASPEEAALARFCAWLALGEAVARDGAAPAPLRALCRQVLAAAGRPLS